MIQIRQTKPLEPQNKMNDFRIFILLAFPTILILRPPFIRSYFKSEITPLVLGVLGYIAIGIQWWIFRQYP